MGIAYALRFAALTFGTLLQRFLQRGFRCDAGGGLVFRAVAMIDVREIG